MAQQIIEDPGSIFGRMGAGFGKGLVEQLPKEFERQRLSSGLKNFEQEHQALTPIQQLARLSSIPGITPQMIQSFSDLARQQSQMNAFSKGVAPKVPVAEPGQQASAISPVQTAYDQQAAAQRGGQTPNVLPTEFGQPQILPQNPLDDRTLTRPPWTPQQRDERISQYIGRGFLADKAIELAADDERRDLESPGAYQKRYDELKGKEIEANKALEDHLKTKLEKGDKGDLYKDITGEMLKNLERGMARDLRLNPNASVQDVANDWSNRALDLAKTKTQFDKLVNTTWPTDFFKGDAIYKKLKEYQDIFKKSGNSEEYFNLLKTGFGMSPQGAAYVAYPLNKDLNNYVKNVYKPVMSLVSKLGLINTEKPSRQAALEVEKHLTGEDSILAVVRALKSEDPNFDEQSFFDQLSEDKDEIRLNPRQRREVAEGISDILPKWGDLLVLPVQKGKL